MHVARSCRHDHRVSGGRRPPAPHFRRATRPPRRHDNPLGHRPSRRFRLRAREHPGRRRQGRRDGLRLGRERRPAHQGRRARRRSTTTTLARTTDVEERLPGPRALEGEGLHRRGDRAAGRGQLVRPRVRGRARADARAVPGPGVDATTRSCSWRSRTRSSTRASSSRPCKVLRQRGLARPGAPREPAGRSRASAPTACERSTSCGPTSRPASSARPAVRGPARVRDVHRPDQPVVHDPLRGLRRRGPRAARVRTASRWRSSPGPWTTRPTPVGWRATASTASSPTSRTWSRGARGLTPSEPAEAAAGAHATALSVAGRTVVP